MRKKEVQCDFLHHSIFIDRKKDMYCFRWENENTEVPREEQEKDKNKEKEENQVNRL